MNYYFHVPFCANKCGYCAFYSLPNCHVTEFDLYLDKLEKQLVYRQSLPIADTIYIGGGTPTLLDNSRLKRLLELIFSQIKRKPNCEISIEANPETIDEKKVVLLKKYVTRLSIGIQSFNSLLRECLGRKCSQKNLIKAINLVKEASFPHWNCDLIYAIPGQTLEQWERDLHAIAEHGCDHVSCYNLTSEEGARLSDLRPANDVTAIKMAHIACKILLEYGITQYEISNYAKKNGQCDHNVRVWRGEKLLGFGPSAAGFDGNNRVIEVSSLEQWLHDAPPQLDKLLTSARLNEIFAVNLRTVKGWAPQLWSRVPHADSWSNRLKMALEAERNFPKNFFHITPRKITLNNRGRLFWNEIAEFLI